MMRKLCVLVIWGLFTSIGVLKSDNIEDLVAEHFKKLPDCKSKTDSIDVYIKMAEISLPTCPMYSVSIMETALENTRDIHSISSILQCMFKIGVDLDKKADISTEQFLNDYILLSKHYKIFNENYAYICCLLGNLTTSLDMARYYYIEAEKYGDKRTKNLSTLNKYNVTIEFNVNSQEFIQLEDEIMSYKYAKEDINEKYYLLAKYYSIKKDTLQTNFYVKKITNNCSMPHITHWIGQYYYELENDLQAIVYFKESYIAYGKLKHYDSQFQSALMLKYCNMNIGDDVLLADYTIIADSLAKLLKNRADIKYTLILNRYKHITNKLKSIQEQLYLNEISKEKTKSNIAILIFLVLFLIALFVIYLFAKKSNSFMQKNRKLHKNGILNDEIHYAVSKDVTALYNHSIQNNETYNIDSLHKIIHKLLTK